MTFKELLEQIPELPWKLYADNVYDIDDSKGDLVCAVNKGEFGDEKVRAYILLAANLMPEAVEAMTATMAYWEACNKSYWAGAGPGADDAPHTAVHTACDTQELQRLANIAGEKVGTFLARLETATNENPT